MGMTCSKCGSSEILSEVTIVAGVDTISSVPVSRLAYRRPESRIFRGPAPHRLLARIRGARGFAELDLEAPGASRP